MIQSFNTEIEIDREYFTKKFKDFDEDGDAELNLKEMSDFLKNLVGKGAVRSRAPLHVGREALNGCIALLVCDE